MARSAKIATLGAPGAGVVLALAAIPFALKVASQTWLPANYAAQSLYKLGQLLVPVVWRRRVDGQWGGACLWPVDQPRPAASTWAAAVIVAGVSILLAALLVPRVASALGVAPAEVRRHLEDKFSLAPSLLLPAIVFLSTLNAGLEELHYRAWLGQELSRRWGPTLGIATSSALFAAMHLFIFAGVRDVGCSALAVLFVVLAAAGTLWSLIALRPGGIHAAWLCHGLTDAGLLGWGLVWLGYWGPSAS